MNKEVYIRVDSSYRIGSGHLMRCLTLAGELQRLEASVSFICREWQGNGYSLIKNRGYPLYLLPPVSMEPEQNDDHRTWLGVPMTQDAADTLDVMKRTSNAKPWLAVDHYSIDSTWEKQLRPSVSGIAVIDDLADRPHDCDLLLDQNYYSNMNERYKGLVPDYCRTLLGPSYALLRTEFQMTPPRRRDGSIRRVLIFYGGSDLTNETGKALQALDKFPFHLDVVIGGSNPHYQQIEELCSRRGSCSFYRQTDNMHGLMQAADLSIGAGGTATWERCILGLPSLVTILAQNQQQSVLDLSEVGVIQSLGWFDQVDIAQITMAVEEFLRNPSRVIQMSLASRKLMQRVQGEYSLGDHIMMTGDEPLAKLEVRNDPAPDGF